jgi:kelch-like protein 10
MDANLGEAISLMKQNQYTQNARNVLAELRKTGQLCDAVIKVEDVEFPIHRAVLSACSPHFRDLFTHEVHKTEKREVIIPGVSANVMRLIVDYAYTKEAHITAENVEIVLPVADQFHVNGLVKACCDFLISRLSADNCIGIRNFAHAYFCHNLERTAHRFLMQNFQEVATKSSEYLQMNIDELCEILSSDELNVRTEELVFGAILRWIDFDPDNRKEYIGRLLRTVRLGLLTTKFFVDKVRLAMRY